MRLENVNYFFSIRYLCNHFCVQEIQNRSALCSGMSQNYFYPGLIYCLSHFIFSKLAYQLAGSCFAEEPYL